MTSPLACIAYCLSVLLSAGQAGPLMDDAFLAFAEQQTEHQVELVTADSLRLAKFVEQGDTLYFAISSDYARIKGYLGETLLGAVYDANGEVRRVWLIDSEDTRSFVRRVDRKSFWRQFRGYTGEQPVEAVTGATITSDAVIETLRRMTGVIRRRLPEAIPSN